MSDLCGMWGPPNGWLCREPKGHDGRHVWRPDPNETPQYQANIRNPVSIIDPTMTVSVREYRQPEDADDTASVGRAVSDCNPGAPNAGKTVCFPPGDTLLDPYAPVRNAAWFLVNGSGR